MIHTNQSSRPYRSELRQQQAQETRQRVVEAALALFSSQGYRATTFSQLAKAAGVSIETVQKHGPKSALLQAAVEFASFGVEGETDIFATDFGKALRKVGDPDALATLVGAAMLEVIAPSAALWRTVVAAAHGDEELSGFQSQMLALVRGQIEVVLRYVEERGWLRRDVPFDDLVEALCVIASVETYVRFVLVDRKSAGGYQAFVSRMLRETILAT